MSDDMDEIKKFRAERRSRPAKPAARKPDQFEEPMEKEDIKAMKEALAQHKKASSPDKAPDFLAEHTVVSGDTLSGIAQKYYGSQANWKAIYEANKDIIGDNPSLIRVGQVFKIPKPD